MKPLNLPAANLRLKNQKEGLYVFDIIRKKYIILTPEEWVRQHVLHFLIQTKSFPASLCAIEKKIILNSRVKRSDLLFYSSSGNPILLVECKRPEQPINEETFLQISRYNMVLNVPYFMLTNGIDHFYYKIDYDKNDFKPIKELPIFKDLQ